MLKLHVNSQISLNMEDLLEGIANLEISELEELADKIIDLRAERRVPSIPQDEAILLEKIKSGVPSQVRRRYEQLLPKLLDESMSPAEHKEYLSLIDQIKLADAERMRNLIALAALRNSTIDIVMDELGLRQPTYA